MTPPAGKSIRSTTPDTRQFPKHRPVLVGFVAGLAVLATSGRAQAQEVFPCSPPTIVGIAWDFNAPGRACEDVQGFVYSWVIDPPYVERWGSSPEPPDYSGFCFDRAHVAVGCGKEASCSVNGETCYNWSRGNSFTHWWASGLRGLFEHKSCVHCRSYGPWPDQFPWGAAGGGASIRIRWSDPEARQNTVEVSSAAPHLPGRWGQVRDCDIVLIRVECIASGVIQTYPVFRCGFPCGDINSPGWVLQNGTWTTNVVFPTCAGSVQFEQRSLAFSDTGFDVDADGRFSQADVNMLANLLGVPLSGAQRRFDQNGNNVVDQEDLEVFRSLVQIGLGAGKFGDANGDGRLTCRDVNAAVGSWGAVAGQPNYNIALDFNLNGCLDSVDQAAFDALTLFAHADVTADGAVDFNDFNEFINWFNAAEARADWNRDGSVDFEDFLDFVNDYNTPVYCP